MQMHAKWEDKKLDRSRKLKYHNTASQENVLLSSVVGHIGSLLYIDLSTSAFKFKKECSTFYKKTGSNQDKVNKIRWLHQQNHPTTTQKTHTHPYKVRS